MTAIPDVPVAAPTHGHPNDHVVHGVNDTRAQLSFPDRSSRTLDLEGGKSLWLEAGPHETRMQACGEIELDVPGVPGLALCASSRDTGRPIAVGYRTAAIKRGLRLERHGRDLCGEGVGFAVPVVRYGSLTVFPGDVAIESSGADGDGATVLSFKLNLVEMVSLGGRPPVQSGRFYKSREYLAGLYRRHPRWRGFLSWGGGIMTSVGRASIVYVPASPVGTVVVTCRPSPRVDRLAIDVDLRGLDAGFDEVSLMNELDGGLFDHYEDSLTGIQRGAAIGAWDEVQAPMARFSDMADGLTFELSRVAGARLFRGREVVPGELSWAGLAHVLPAGTRHFSYEVRLGAAAPGPEGGPA